MGVKVGDKVTMILPRIHYSEPIEKEVNTISEIIVNVIDFEKHEHEPYMAIVKYEEGGWEEFFTAKRYIEAEQIKNERESA